MIEKATELRKWGCRFRFSCGNDINAFQLYVEWLCMIAVEDGKTYIFTKFDKNDKIMKTKT